jgi:hypothetical protein
VVPAEEIATSFPTFADVLRGLGAAFDSREEQPA